VGLISTKEFEPITFCHIIIFISTQPETLASIFTMFLPPGAPARATSPNHHGRPLHLTVAGGDDHHEPELLYTTSPLQLCETTMHRQPLMNTNQAREQE